MADGERKEGVNREMCGKKKRRKLKEKKNNECV